MCRRLGGDGRRGEPTGGVGASALSGRAGENGSEANDFALAAYGYSRDEFAGKTIDVVRAAPAGLTLEERARGLEEAGGRVTVESVHRRRDGVEFPAEVGLSSVVLGGERFYLEFVRDIGERKAAEAALRDSEAR